MSEIAKTTTTTATTECYDRINSTSYRNMSEKKETSTCCFQFRQEVHDLFYELMDFARNRNWKKKLLTLIMMGCCSYVVIDLLFLGYIVEGLHAYGIYVTDHLIGGMWCYIAILVVAALVMIPPMPILFLGGYVFSTAAGRWGIALAFVASLLGCTIGAVLAFFRSRYMMRDLVTLFAKRYRVIRAIHRAMSKHGFRVFLLLRLCPIVPFNGLNHIAGSTDITLEQFIFSLIGIVPVTLLTLVAGATAEQMIYTTEEEEATAVYTSRIVLLVLGLVFCTGAVIGTAYVARQELRKELERERIVAQAEGRDVEQYLEHVSMSGTINDDASFVLDFWHPLEEVEVTSDGYLLYPDGTIVKEYQDEDWIWLFP